MELRIVGFEGAYRLCYQSVFPLLGTKARNGTLRVWGGQILSVAFSLGVLDGVSALKTFVKICRRLQPHLK